MKPFALRPRPRSCRKRAAAAWLALALGGPTLAQAQSAGPAEPAAASSPAAAASAPASDTTSPGTPAPAAGGRHLRPLWEWGLGLGVLNLPHYRGSDQSRSWLLPVGLFVYNGKIFKSDRDGARAVLFDSGSVDFDVSLAAGAPSSSGSNRARAGMSDLAPTIEIGPNLNWTLHDEARWRLQVRAPVRAALTLGSKPRDIGFVATPHLGLDLRGPGSNLGFAVGPVWGSRRYHRYFYEVSAQDATVDRPAYAASSGAGGWHAVAAWSQRRGRWWWGAFVSHDRLQGAAFIDSPLVRKTHNWSFGTGLSWMFQASDRQVEVDNNAL